MKHNSFWAICLLLLAGTVLTAFGQHQAVNLESRVLESFNNTEDSLYVWRKDASGFAVGKSPEDRNNPAFAELGLEDGDFFPKLNFFDIWPIALHRSNRENK